MTDTHEKHLRIKLLAEQKGLKVVQIPQEPDIYRVFGYMRPLMVRYAHASD